MNLEKGLKVIKFATRLIGAPYLWGSRSIQIEKDGSYTNGKNNYGKFKGGLDCSGFIIRVFKEFGNTLNGTALSMCKDSGGKQSVISTTFDMQKMQPGDLVYFWGTYDDKGTGRYYATNFRKYKNPKSAPQNVKENNISHVGIYYGNGLMIHAASGSGRTLVNNLSKSSYWLERFAVVKRMKN